MQYIVILIGLKMSLFNMNCIITSKRSYQLKMVLFLDAHIIKCFLAEFYSSESNMESKSSNNTYLNIIETFFFILKNIEFKNLVVTLPRENMTFLSWKNKSLLPLLDECKQWINFFNLWNIWTMLNNCIIQWFSFDVTRSSQIL